MHAAGGTLERQRRSDRAMALVHSHTALLDAHYSKRSNWGKMKSIPFIDFGKK